MAVGNWFEDTEKAIVAFFSSEEKLLLEFFGPLLEQVKNEALKVGLDDLKLGLDILKAAALAAAEAAEGAPAGVDKAKLAEEAFVSTTKAEAQKVANTVVASATGLYQNTVNNAEAAAIKAAVAIIQAATVSAVVPANTEPVANN